MKMVRFGRLFVFTPLLLAALLALSAPGHAQNGKPRILGYFLMLDGEPMGWMYAVEGAGLDADVLPDKSGDDGFLRKHIGAVKYEDIKITCGSEMSKKFYEWIKASFDGRDAKHARKNGAIIAADYDYKVVRRLDFQQALITEFGIPALDSEGRNVAARLFVRFQPDQRTISGGGGPIDAPPMRHKAWLTSNFRLTIDGLEQACTRVNKIEAITLKQRVSEEGDAGLPLRDAGDLAFTIPVKDSDPIMQWFEMFVVNAKGGTRAAMVECLRPNGTPLFTLHLPSTGVYSQAWEFAPAEGDAALKNVKFRCYCDTGYFDYSVE